MVERSLCMREARGSIPRISIVYFNYVCNFFFCYDNNNAHWFLAKDKIDLQFLFVAILSFSGHPLFVASMHVPPLSSISEFIPIQDLSSTFSNL